MLAVVQRVTSATVSVATENYAASIGQGLVILLGVETKDTEAEAKWLAAKIARLRIFRDDEDKMNRSVQDIAGEALIVSQFTLAGDVSGGHRPSFITAARPEQGRPLYELVCDLLASEHRVPVKRGIFGAMMQLSLVNDGPVTIIIRR